MPKEFQDFADDMGKAIDPVADSLANVRKLADEADTAYSKFASSVVASSNKISGVVANVEKSLGDIGKKSDDLSKKSGSLNKSIEGASKQLENFEKSVPKKVESKFLTSLQKDIDAAQLELERMKAGMIKMDFDKVLKLEVEISKLGELSKWTDSLSDAQKETNDFVLANYKLDGSLDAIIRKNDALGASILSAATATKEQVASMQESSRESRKVASATDLVRKKIDEGKDSAEGFADGLGANSGVMMGMAVAAIYLANKIADMGDAIVDARSELAKFNIDITALESQMSLAGFTGSVKQVRGELDLTRDQTRALVDVMVDADKAGVIAADQFVQVARQMKDAFGGDQTERLKEFVDILKELPNVMEDFSASADPANIDAAVYALGQLGNLAEVADTFARMGIIEMDVEQLSREDKEFLDSIQQTNAVQESVKDVLLRELPAITPQVTAIAGTLVQVAGFAGAGFTAVGAAMKFLSTQQFGTTTAVYKTAGASAMLGPAGKGAKGAGKMMGKMGGLMKFGGGAIVASTVGMGLNLAAEKTEHEGTKKALKGGSKVAGIAGGALTGAAIGSVIPGVGTAIGAAVGAAIPAGLWIADIFKGTGEKVEEVNEEYDKQIAAAEKMIAHENKEISRLGQLTKSGLQRAKSRKKLDQVFSGSTFLLQKFNSQVASVELDNLENFGPISGNFNDAISRATKAFENELDANIKALEKHRREIENSDMSEKDRAIERKRADQLEIEARSQYADSTLKAAAAIMKVPALIENALERDRIMQIFEAMSAGGVLDVTGVWDDINKNIAKGLEAEGDSGTAKKIATIRAKRDKAKAEGDDTEFDIQNKALTQATDARDAFHSGLRSAISSMGDGVDATVSAQERIIMEFEGLAGAATEMGDGVQGAADVMGKKIGLVPVAFGAWKEQIVKAENSVVATSEALAEGERKLKKLRVRESRAMGKDHKASLQAEIKEVEIDNKQLAATAGLAQGVLAKKKGELGEISGSGLSIEEIFSQMIEASEAGMIGRRIAAEFNFAETLSNAAEFSNNFAALAGQSTAISIQAARDKLNIEMRAAKKAQALGMEELHHRMEMAKARGEDPEVVRQQGMAELAARAQNAKFKAEADFHRDTLDAITKEADIQDRVLDIQRDSVDTELDFLNEIGGSFSSIMALQEKGIAIEQKKLAIYQEELKAVRATGKGGAVLQDAELKVFKQRLEIEKQAMGAQKDVADKLLGRAFGAIRGELGAARGRGGAVGLLGRDRTRVMNRAGTFIEGDAMPIAERAARMNIARLGGGGGAGVPGLRGQLGQMLPAVGGAAQRMPFEAGIAKGLGRGGAIDLGGGKMIDVGAGAPPPAPMGAGGGFRQAGPELPPPIPVEASMKAEVRVTFDNKMFREQVIQIVNQEVLGGRTSKDLKNKMDKANIRFANEMMNDISTSGNNATNMNNRNKSSNANISPGLGVS